MLWYTLHHSTRRARFNTIMMNFGPRRRCSLQILQADWGYSDVETLHP